MRREWTSSGVYGTLALAPVIVAATVVVSGWATAQEPPPPPVPVPFSGQGQGQATDQGEGEVLTRGPVHEAFAGPVVFNPSAGPVVPKAPPGRVEAGSARRGLSPWQVPQPGR